LELGGQYDWNLQLFVLDWHVIRMFLFVFMRIILTHTMQT
jgi:hypothetical protein